MYENNNTMVYPAPAQAVPAPVQVPTPAAGGLMFPPLGVEDVEARVATCSDKGVSLLLYKNARTDMQMLDAVVGPTNWQNEFKTVDGVLYCRIGINRYYYDPTHPAEWIWREDCGSAGNIEVEKSTASDARKRAGFCIGIGRELYTSPFVWIKNGNCNLTLDSRKKWTCSDRFAVTEMYVEDGKIIRLAIANNSMGGRVVFTWVRPGYAPQPVPSGYQQPAQYAPAPPPQYRG